MCYVHAISLQYLFVKFNTNFDFIGLNSVHWFHIVMKSVSCVSSEGESEDWVQILKLSANISTDSALLTLETVSVALVNSTGILPVNMRIWGTLIPERDHYGCCNVLLFPLWLFYKVLVLEVDLLL